MKCNSLDLVLQLSRLFGIAPYIRGSQYDVSRAIDICGKMIMTLATVLSFIAVVYNIFFNKKPLLPTVDIIHVGYRLLLGVIILTGTFTAAGRMTRMSQILKQLEQVDLNVRLRRKSSGNRKMFILVLMYITITFIVRLPTIFNSFMVRLHFLWPLINVFEHQIVVFLEMQIILLAARVLLTLETINDNLEELIPAKNQISTPDIKPTVPRVAWENINNFKMNTMKFNRNSKIKCQGAENNSNVDSIDANVALTIRHLRIHYYNICGVVRTITKGDGCLMIMLLIYHMLHLEASSYKVIIGVSNFEFTFYDVLLFIIPSIIDVTALILFTEPFHQTHMQMDRTHLAINYLKCRRGDDDEVSNELEMFLRVILLNRTTYSPLSVCTLARALVVKILGSLVTYLVIILTYGPEMKDPALALADKKAFV